MNVFSRSRILWPVLGIAVGVMIVLLMVYWSPLRTSLSSLTRPLTGSYAKTDFRRSMSVRKSLRSSSQQHVIAVSIDGLRAGVIPQLGLDKLSNFAQLMREGASTLNARTDAAYTLTLPNHTCMLTGRGVVGPQGHGYNHNHLPGKTLHQKKGHYIASVFDTLHNHGYSTALFASKQKFVLYAWSYNEQEGELGKQSRHQSRNKIDEVQITTQDRDTMYKLLTTLQAPNPPHFLFVHLRGPDAKGHKHGWESQNYLDAVIQQDWHIGQIMQTIQKTPHLHGNTTLLVTTDHGGTRNGHRDARNPIHYRIPFWVWGKSVKPGTDLYALNPDGYQDPGSINPGYDAPKQPVRNGNVANLVTQLFGLPPVTGSTIGVRYPLRIHTSDTRIKNSTTPPRTGSWN